MRDIAVHLTSLCRSLSDTDSATKDESREHNARGFFVSGPQMVNPSDVLAKLIDMAKLALTEAHYAPDPIEERRSLKIQRGRTAYRRRYPSHGRSEFYSNLKRGTA